MNQSNSEFYINKCIALGNLQAAKGNPPFAAILVLDEEIVVEGYSTIGTDNYILGHSEMNLVTAAIDKLTPEQISRSVMYSNAEPCAMCAGAIFNSGIRHLVYGVPTEALLKYFDNSIALPCRDVFDSCSQTVNVEGPILVEKALLPFKQFWGC